MLQAIHGIRCERMLIERLDFNLLSRWFVGLNPDFVYTKNRDRLLNEEAHGQGSGAAAGCSRCQASAEFRALLAGWHPAAGLGLPPPPIGGKGFGSAPAKVKKRAKGDCRGPLLSNQTHRSSSDGEARLFKKAPGVGAILSFMGHCLLENRHGLVVASEVIAADGYGARAAALRMAGSLAGAHKKTLGADKGYDTKDVSLICASRASRRSWVGRCSGCMWWPTT